MELLQQETDDLHNASPCVEGRSLWKNACRRFLKNRAAVGSIIVLGVITLFLLLAPLFSPYTYDELDWSAMRSKPSLTNRHYFGTDSLGRDLFVRTATGGRISLLVGIAGALVAVVFGLLYGATAGYLGGRVDSIMMRLLEVLDAFPFMFFVILLVTFLGRHIILIFVAIGMVSWLNMARIVRGLTLSLKRKEFIEAAYVSGTSHLHIVLRHIIPNLLGTVAVYASLSVPAMILFESFLSFLGLGVQEPMASWGSLLEEGAKSMDMHCWLLLFPATFLILTLFCCNFIGDGLRDALDPKDGERGI